MRRQTHLPIRAFSRSGGAEQLHLGRGRSGARPDPTRRWYPLPPACQLSLPACLPARLPACSPAFLDVELPTISAGRVSAVDCLNHSICPPLPRAASARIWQGEVSASKAKARTGRASYRATGTRSRALGDVTFCTPQRSDVATRDQCSERQA